ncbi:hypothetical protein LCY76_23555 [Fictibacillus sp. KIGAM418]|uniref:Uncharacterized protein n=1 Tax=Fictibacillus marinisediminis TaxID=2878389 RepID=A0A9X1XEW7_9BACL|nr:hypothetical protein [Fictibacillus marinisediminis]MCK6259549.1 hypothetical protein [Fictibacillus marinisediminis]
MKEFSAKNILGQEMQNMYENSLIRKALSSMTKNTNVILSVEIPKSIYLRGEIFCSDVADEMEEDFTSIHLLGWLYTDFLKEIRHRQLNDVYRLLSESNTYSTKPIVKKVIKYRTNLTTLQDEPYDVLTTEKPLDAILLRFAAKRKLILRGEVLLQDLATQYPSHDFTVEKLLTILYCDFIEKVKSGQFANAIKVILDRMDRDL